MSTASRRNFLAAASGAGAAALAVGTQAAGAEAREVALLSTYIAGIGRHCGSAVASRLEPGEPVTLRREPENDYDPRAVAVWTARGEKLGYVPRIDNQTLANLIDAGLPVRAEIRSVRRGGLRPEVLLDMRMTL